MKIAIATAVYYPQINGVAVFSYNLARGLARRGHEVVVICPSQTRRNYVRMVEGVKVCYLKSVEAKVYPDQIHPAEKKWRLWYKHGFKVSIFPRKEVAKILGDFGPDVVHVQVSDPIGLSVVGWARKHGVPVVTTEHNQPEIITDPLKMPRVLKKPMNALLAAYFRNRQSKSDFVTMPTEQAIRGLLARRDLGVPVAAVSNGVDLRCFQPGKAAAGIYKKYGLPADRPMVLYVGRVDPEKRIDLVIRAFGKVLTLVPEAVLVVVGDGVDRCRLEKLVDNLRIGESVKFLGKVLAPDLYELYKVGWVFATASEVETQGIVLIEAAASGLPLIAVNKGAVSEICLDGENGFLCKAGSVDGLAGAMEKILVDEELRLKFRRKSVEIAKEHDLEKTLDKFENIYRRVMEK